MEKHTRGNLTHVYYLIRYPDKEWDWLAYFTVVPKGLPVYVSKVADHDL
jgi:hypothetical protein